MLLMPSSPVAVSPQMGQPSSVLSVILLRGGRMVCSAGVRLRACGSVSPSAACSP
jgi:hypothetical protein